VPILFFFLQVVFDFDVLSLTRLLDKLVTHCCRDSVIRYFLQSSSFPSLIFLDISFSPEPEPKTVCIKF
jgi:hypothetical protein